MARYCYGDKWYTVDELADLSGIKAHTIRDRLRRGYTVEEAIKVTAVYDSVKAFNDASLWEDWIGLSISDLFEIYWGWCIQNGYTAIQKQGFSRQLLSMYPMLKIVPTKQKNKYQRIIRVRG